MKKKVPLCVAIAGGSGSGKSTVVRELCKRFSQFHPVVIHQDNYYRDLSHLTPDQRNQVNFDHPEAFDFNLMHEQIVALSKGEAVVCPHYDYATHTRKKEGFTIEPKELIFFDGIFALHFYQLLPLFPIRIFVAASPDLRLARRLLRDVGERQRSVKSILDQYLASVRPMHQLFVEITKQNATHCLTWEQWDEEALNNLSSVISKGLSQDPVEV